MSTNGLVYSPHIAAWLHIWRSPEVGKFDVMILASNLLPRPNLAAGGEDDSVTILGRLRCLGGWWQLLLPASPEQKTFNVAQLHQGLLKIMASNHRCGAQVALGARSRLHKHSRLWPEVRQGWTMSRMHITEECASRSQVYITQKHICAWQLNICKSWYFPMKAKLTFRSGFANLTYK